MIFTETELPGAFVIDLERYEDERGFFARSFCKVEFERQALLTDFVQCNVSFNRLRGTLRGMHYQVAPNAEVKLVRCTAGNIHDVIVDLRPGSPTFYRWIGADLTADNRRMFYIPEGFAHGFVTLEDNTEVFYHMGNYAEPAAARGFRWNDPFFGIKWPETPRVLSPRDLDYDDFDPTTYQE